MKKKNGKTMSLGRAKRDPVINKFIHFFGVLCLPPVSLPYFPIIVEKKSEGGVRKHI